ADELAAGALRLVGAEGLHVPVEVCAWRRLDLTHRRAVRLFEALPSLAAAPAVSVPAARATPGARTRGNTRGTR
ncbi:MAG: hypothetical protein Q8R98_00760, partial [Rubrivivax sp.]|nr:hypothetical protein [Rubrivivax sp.]